MRVKFIEHLPDKIETAGSISFSGRSLNCFELVFNQAVHTKRDDIKVV